jgi:C-terminal processing protease CtpA/Prc
MKTWNKLILLLLLACVTAVSCKKEEDTGSATIKAVDRGIYDLMKDVYLWYDHLPDVDPTTYSTPDDLMNALRYTAYDKWSTVLTKTDYNQYFQEGQMIGHGFLLAVDASNNLRIAFVYRNTEAYNLGVRRSWILTRVNGTAANTGNVFDLLGPSEAGRSNSITFINSNGETVDLNLTKEVVAITPVVHYEVLHQGDTKIGYMVFQDFIDTARAELDEVFDSFTSQGIDEMIVDLRYNGGGSVDVAEYLAGWLMGKNHGNQPFVNFRHNNKHTSWDTTLNIPARANGLALNRIFFIGTSSTASASELMINGTKPYLNPTILAGSTTHGKPVGMYAFPFTNYNYVVLPIAFRYTNANDAGDFYSGLAPDLSAEDDLTRDFGNPEEASLKAILDYIAGGIVPLKSARATEGINRLIGSDKGIGQYLKAY